MPAGVRRFRVDRAGDEPDQCIGGWQDGRSASLWGATRTWQRTLDDRIGISWEEGVRKARRTAPPLPVTENLRADKPEHVSERRPRDLTAADDAWARHLKAVPELAGGHHEKMDGTGYPKRLSRNDMSVPARIMAIADIFEALTADRPYKKGKMLSEAIKIMGAMRKDRHIDPDLFELFLRSGVYRDYAMRFLKPEIDEIDLDAYLRQPVAA